jgi:CheY-like chemotaxis protein
MPKLLVVDGSPKMHRIMELTFAPEGIQVVTASDGDQAVALLPIARPDVVIADHAVSGTSGYELSAFVRSHPDLGGVPVLLLASPFEPLDRARAEACGVAGEIAKPFEPAHLIARVRELLTPKPAPEPEQEPDSPPAPAEGRTPALKLVEPPSPPARAALDDYFDRLDAALERLDDQIAQAEAPADQDDPGLPTIDKILGEERGAPRGAVLIDHPLRGAYGATEGSGSTANASAEPTTAALAGEGDALHQSHEVTATASGSLAPADRSDVIVDPDDKQHVLDAGPSRGRDLSSLVEALEALRRRGPVEAPLPALPFSETTPAPKPPAEVTDAMIDEVTRRVVERLAPGAIDRIVTDVVTRVAEKLLREEIARLK